MLSLCSVSFLFYKSQVFEPGTRGRRLHVSGFLKSFLFVLWYVCVSLSVRLPLRALITSGMIWCDIDRVRLIKQVYGFSGYRDKLERRDLSNTASHARQAKISKLMPH